MPLPRTLDLNLLRIFDVLMEERSVTAAARQLNMTQSSCSNALNRLRTALGDTLLERQGHKMVPSQFAEEFWPTVRQALTDLGDGFSELQSFSPRDLSRHLRIGMDPYASAAFGAKIATAIMHAAPNARTSIVPVNVNTLESDRSQLDIAIGTIWSAQNGIEKDAILEDSFVVLLRRGHPLVAQGKSIELTDYQSAKHLLLSDKGIVTGNVDIALRTVGCARQTHLASPLCDTLADVLAQTDCIATLGNALADRLSQRADLVAAKPPITLTAFPISVAWHKRDAKARHVTWLRNLCREAMLSGKIGDVSP